MENQTQMSVERAKRVKLLKKIIIWGPISLIAVAFLLCIVLFVRMSSLRKEVQLVRNDLDKTIQMMDAQQRVLESMEGQLAEALEALETRQTGSGVADNSAQENLLETETGYLTINKDISEYEHRVYLTFDDGPSPNTENILDALEKYHVKATFFVIGNETEEGADLVRMTLERGHSLGMHSYTHRYSELYASLQAFSDDFAKIRQNISDTTGVDCKLYRFPGGSSNQVSKVDMRILADFLDQQDTIFFDWNASAQDAVNYRLTADQLVDNLMENYDRYPDIVMLMHDSEINTNTVEAIPKLIERILERGDSVILPITDETKLIQHLQR